MAATMQIERVSAQRMVAGIDRFAIHGEDADAGRVRLRRHWGGRAGLRLGMGLTALVIVALGGLGIAALAASARDVSPEPTASSTPVAAPEHAAASAWIEVRRPLPLFDLTGSDFAKLAMTYRARRRGDATARQDLLAYGEFAGDKPFLFLSILRAAPGDTPARFFVGAARLAEEEDLGILRSGLPDLVPTRFGSFEAADLTLRGDGASRSCLAFRPSAESGKTGPVVIEGLACGIAARPMDRRQLACVVDRIDLLAAGDDTVLQSFFVAAELRPGQNCNGLRMTPALRQETWLDGGSVSLPLRKGEHGLADRTAEHVPARPALSRHSEL